MLDIKKIEGGITLNICELNLPDIIDDLNTVICPQSRARQQNLKIMVSSFTHEHLPGDKLHINQILINILSNAVKAMAKSGVQVHYATGGQETIQMIQAAREDGLPYDLILLDWKMPDLDGMETARPIRKNSDFLLHRIRLDRH